MQNKLYKLVSVTDKQGKPSYVYEVVKSQHSLYGILPNLKNVRAGGQLIFRYNDSSGLELRTSTLSSISESVGGRVVAVTQNSIYTFEPVKKLLTTEVLRQFCIDNGYFTCGSNEQYKRLFELNDMQADMHELALVIWICSDTAILEQIEEELDDLLDQQELNIES